MNIPLPPLRTGNIQQDVDRLYWWISQVIIALQAESGWSTTGTVSRKGVVSGDTLVHTQDVLGTLVQTLEAKGLLTA